jgi:ABC-type lipoprotein export system ATPase subunit
MNDAQEIMIARGLHKSFGKGLAKNHVLHGLDLSVKRGEFLAVMGPSGCGKSTLLHILGLMTPPDNGQLEIFGQSVTQEKQRAKLRREDIGFVFQRFNLLSVLTGRENVKISLRVRKLLDKFGPDVDGLFEEMGVSDVAGRKPGQMSIGQQQRVAVVRAMAHKPKILLADEPTGNLDSENGKSLLELFRRLNENDSQTIVMITHSKEAADFADRTIYMKDGRVE